MPRKKGSRASKTVPSEIKPRAEEHPESAKDAGLVDGVRPAPDGSGPKLLRADAGNVKHQFGSYAKLLELLHSFLHAIYGLWEKQPDGSLMTNDEAAAIEILLFASELNSRSMVEFLFGYEEGRSSDGWSAVEVHKRPLFRASDLITSALCPDNSPWRDIEECKGRRRDPFVMQTQVLDALMRAHRILETYASSEVAQSPHTKPPRGDEVALRGATAPDAVDPVAVVPKAEATEPGQHEFVNEGKVWRVRFGGKTRRLPHSVGLERLHRLLSEQGKEVAALELAGRMTSYGGDEAADALALQEVGTRVKELEGVVESGGDPARVVEAREELETLRRYQATATGIGGKARRPGDERKAAANAVGKSIKGAIGMLAREGLEELAVHLRSYIIKPTSISPVYRPFEQIDWVLRA